MSSSMVPWKDCWSKSRLSRKQKTELCERKVQQGSRDKDRLTSASECTLNKAFLFVCYVKNKEFIINPSSETQGQIVGKREGLNGRENVARRKVKNGEKSPWGQCLTRPVPNGRRRSGFWLVPEKHKFSSRSSRRSLLFFVPYIFFRPFRLSLVPFICPWVSEDVINPDDRMFFLFTTSPSIVDNKLRFLFPKARQAHYDDYVLCT